MQEVRRKKGFFFVLFTLIAVFIAGSVLFRPVLKWMYPVSYLNFIEKYSAEYELDEYLVMGIISAESGFDHNAESHREARGLMQLKEETALWCIENYGIDAGEKDLFDPELNINVGCAYVRYLLDKYEGNTLTALAAYNAGEGNVSKWLEEESENSGNSLSDIPFEETDNYVKKVDNRTNMYRFLYA